MEIKNVELDFTNEYGEDVRFSATLVLEIVDGEVILTGAISEERNEIFGVEKGDWFDPSDRINVEELIEENPELLKMMNM